MCKCITVNNMQLAIIYLIFQIQSSLTSSAGKPNKQLPIVLMNAVEVNEVSKVNHINLINNFVHKDGCVNQVHEVWTQCTCSMMHNL